mmetsp:Transcript_6788/g.12574  ORF Transcript_6788/g.12574 Transcript_6788/m.12574 type:complete len:333 (-) Transcript_6788:144-1142(-)
MIPTSTPVLSLRMRSSHSGPPPEFAEGCNHGDRVKAMIMQEQSGYKCEDYIGRRSCKESSACDSDQMDIDQIEHFNSVDAVCREKMCEWSYRVCDHFHAQREVVAHSFSFLDRFVDKCSCDRSAFKLAAMTTLYMAAKISGSHRITIQSLAELSRGEFETSHISEMEGIILQTLNWRLNPPTAQCFINSFYNYLPVSQGSVSLAIYQRAMFFAELSLYDYVFVTKQRSLTAVAAMMNAMEGMDETVVPQQQQKLFVSIINTTFGLNFTEEEVESTRNRLWYVYSMSAQYMDDDAVTPDLVKKETRRKHVQSGVVSPSSSPVSVTATVPHHRS